MNTAPHVVKPKGRLDSATGPAVGAIVHSSMSGRMRRAIESTP